MNNSSKPDWASVDAMQDEDIDTSEIPPLSEDFFANAQLRMPESSEAFSIFRIPVTGLSDAIAIQ